MPNIICIGGSVGIDADFKKELSLFDAGYRYVIGIDEVGRGPFAGPIVAGAVVVDRDTVLVDRVRDSKLLSEPQRIQIQPEIVASVAAYGVGEVSSEEIDNLGLTLATRTAMQRSLDAALAGLDSTDSIAIIIDGLSSGGIQARYAEEYLVNGDELHYSIAAASIIAKVYRDNLMDQFDIEYPEYGFAKHKGYGTRAHTEAIARYGITPIHRKSFKPIQKYL